MMSSALRTHDRTPALRIATAADLPVCAAIINDYIDATEWLPRTLDREAIEALFIPSLLEARTLFVAEEHGEILGYLSMNPDDGFVPALYLGPAARGKGVGKALLDAAKAAHPNGLELTVFERNTDALRFYEREGFSEDPSRRDDTTEEGIPTLWMRLAARETRMNEPSFIRDRLIPVGSILLVILIAWYVAAYSMNAPFQRDFDRRADETRTSTEFFMKTMTQPKPTMPAPHQVASNLWKNTFTVKPWSKRSLVYHSWITLSATLLGFAMGTALGVAIAIGIVHIPALDRSFLPWIIASQTIPILAIAPMIIVLLSAIGVTGLLPKALISTYLSFFPVAVGMVKGLRSPDVLHLDLMRTYSANKLQTLWKLRIPASVPFFFTSMKVAIAASLIGAIVGELPTGAVAGIGSKLLAGSYYSQTVDIFAALIAGSVVAILLVTAVDVVGRFVNARMGAKTQ